jgi:hypothetical protein
MQAPAVPAVSDAARRIADAMTLHTLAGQAGMWASFRMSDGTEVHRGAAYAIREDAVKAAGWNRDTTVYLEIQADGMPVEAAQACLDFQRQLHDAGFRLPDPTFHFDISRPMFPWDRRKMIRHLASGGRAYPKG